MIVTLSSFFTTFLRHLFQDSDEFGTLGLVKILRFGFEHIPTEGIEVNDRVTGFGEVDNPL
jgi:hypothetical protein